MYMSVMEKHWEVFDPRCSQRFLGKNRCFFRCKKIRTLCKTEKIRKFQKKFLLSENFTIFFLSGISVMSDSSDTH